uniref:Ovule protein n=1 Tax=Caenorhabditis tropicalis TaxID=1561998 RepID=A0A1I7V3A4_9PELO
MSTNARSNGNSSSKDPKTTYSSPYVFSTQGVDASDPSKIVIPDFKKLLEEHSAWSSSIKEEEETVYGGEQTDSGAVTDEEEVEVVPDEEMEEEEYSDEEEEEEDTNAPFWAILKAIDIMESTEASQ